MANTTVLIDFETVSFIIWKQVRNANGAGERDRTPDILITSEALYQLSYAGAKSYL